MVEFCIDPILTYGSEEQKQKYVKPLATGEKIGAFALTEPGAGTDAQGAQTKAVLDGDERYNRQEGQEEKEFLRIYCR